MTLDKAVDICRAAEAAKSQMHVMQTVQSEAAVEALKVATSAEKPKAGKRGKPRPPDKLKAQEANQKACRKCGGTHKPRQCPAFGATCHNCGKRNHYAKVCTSPHEKVGTVRRVNDLDREVESLFIGTMSCADSKHTAQPT